MLESEMLRRAKARIQKPENRLRGIYALDNEGLICDPSDPKACKFCSAGALLVEQPHNQRTWEAARQILANAFAEMQGGYGDVYTQDNMTHEQVMFVWDTAIANAEAIELRLSQKASDELLPKVNTIFDQMTKDQMEYCE